MDNNVAEVRSVSIPSWGGTFQRAWGLPRLLEVGVWMLDRQPTILAIQSYTKGRAVITRHSLPNNWHGGDSYKALTLDAH
jgi:hypothetical protein